MTLARFYIVGFMLLLLFDTLAQVSFKFVAIDAAPFAVQGIWLIRVLHSPWLSGCIFGYLGAFVTWMTLLKHAPIGPAVAASHLEIVPVMLLSVPLFNEYVNVEQLIGAAMIVIGVVCLGISETNAR